MDGAAVKVWAWDNAAGAWRVVVVNVNGQLVIVAA